MFSLMDKVPSGIEPMLKDLEEHIINAGLADMVAAAETITTVSMHCVSVPQVKQVTDVCLEIETHKWLRCWCDIWVKKPMVTLV